MTRLYKRLAWAAAVATYLLIVLGAVVRITGSGLGCGDHWPRCNGRWFPPLDDVGTLIEWNHRLVAAIVSTLVVLVAAMTWWERRGAGIPQDAAVERRGIGPAGYVALGLLGLQIALGAVTVKLELPPWTVILHLGTAMLLLAVLLLAALGAPPGRPSVTALAAAGLGFVTVLFGALTANLGAATACIGFPLCNGQIVPVGNYLQHTHWTHRLLAYGLFVYLLAWTWRSRGREGGWAPAALLGVAVMQIGLAAAMVRLTVPPALQAAHAAVGAALWAGLVVVMLREPSR